MNPKTPRQRRKAKNFNLILETAASLVVEKGIENVSLRQIAKEADYSPAGLYKYFDGKAAIFKSLLAYENAGLLERLAAVPSNLTGEQRLVESCLVYIQFNLEYPAYPILVNTLTADRKKMSDPVPENSPYAAFNLAVQRWISESGVILEYAYGPEEITYALWSMVHGMATLRLKQLKDFEADFETVNRRTIQIYLKGFHCE